jgi:hypothetical protein
MHFRNRHACFKTQLDLKKPDEDIIVPLILGRDEVSFISRAVLSEVSDKKLGI